jgi:GNAT superfamily N-acetyltransferase
VVERLQIEHLKQSKFSRLNDIRMTKHMAQINPDKITINLAPTFDASAIAGILEEARHWIASKGIKQWREPFSTTWVEQKIADQEFYCARCDGRLVAVLRLLQADSAFWPNAAPDALYVHSLCVQRDYAGHGIGLFCLRWAEAQAKALNKNYLRLDCVAENDNLCAYYRQAGFQSCGLRQIGACNVMLFQKTVA